MARNSVNPLIRLVPKFAKDKYRGGSGKSTFRKEDVTAGHIQYLINSLTQAKNEYKKVAPLSNYLITIRYKSVVSKSRRIKRIFSFENTSPFDCVVGASYYHSDDGFLKHRITYFVTEANINNTLAMLKQAKNVVEDVFSGVFKNEYMSVDNREQQNILFEQINTFKKTTFYELMCDISNIDSFCIYVPVVEKKDNCLLTFFPIFSNQYELKKYLISLGLTSEFNCLDENTVIIKNQFDLDIILKKNPFIIFQGVNNMEDYDFEEVRKDGDVDTDLLIETPQDQPTIGVFDSYFDKNSYFNEWVECIPCYPSEIVVDPEDMDHATKVCNFLVDCSRYNKWLEDGCGHFKVKLYEIALRKRVNTQFIFDNLERIVSENPDIKVWNFSIGGIFSVNMNQISLLGAKLDYVSKKYNVIFVVSGTNLLKEYPEETTVGSPADSLNALVVNSVDRDNKPAPYTRTGPVLTLYTKPDVAYYGGTVEDPLIAYSPMPNNYKCCGTSFAAPLVARKLAYLIHYLHLEPLVAKALIIDSACRWNEHGNMMMNHKIGYGVVPKDIKEIIYSDSDEIKFVISDVTQEYYTKLMTIPVPLDSTKNKFMYTAKATLCCFTTGDRNNGVDYSSIEMEIKFGRNIQKYSKKDNVYYISVDSINKDKQYEEDGYVDENKACIEFQKWNNTKHLMRPIGTRKQGISPKYGKFWGISITQIDRLNEKLIPINEKYGLKFGIVITLKQVKGEDAQVETFVADCAELKLNPIIVDEAYNLKLYNEENATVKWKD